MADLEVLQQDVTPWVEKALEKENIKGLKVKVNGKPDKGEGYSGEVVFVTVTGSTEDNKDVQLELVLKMGKINEMLKAMGLASIYKREIYVYDTILPAFRKFQEEKGLHKIFDATPKCYNTFVSEDVELIVLENLKERGYALNDRHIPMNTAHIKLVLDNYAKFHATSFAMKDQNKEEFDRLTTDYDCFQKLFLVQEQLKQMFEFRFAQMTELLKELDQDLYKMFLKVFERGLLPMCADMINADVKESVINHADCWNNNFMFKYEVSFIISIL